jgi:hypothetical protein
MEERAGEFAPRTIDSCLELFRNHGRKSKLSLALLADFDQLRSYLFVGQTESLDDSIVMLNDVDQTPFVLSEHTGLGYDAGLHLLLGEIHLLALFHIIAPCERLDELVIENILLRHALLFKDCDACINHEGTTAKVCFFVGRLIDVFGDDFSDQSRLAVPIVTRAGF